MRAVHLLSAIAVAVTMALPVEAQDATIVGRVIAKGTSIPIGYSVVTMNPDRELFTTGDGRFLIRRVPAGRVTIGAKHIGYTPFDTTVTTFAGDTLHLTLELSLMTIRLPAIQSLAKSCGHPGTTDPNVGIELAMLFEQVKQNADRNRLLSRSYPFLLHVERKITKPEPALEARFIAYDTIIRTSERDWRYAPGRMVGTRDYESGVFAGRWSTITMPELADFADERFLNNHCFDYGGLDVVNGDTLLRIDFTPAPTVRDPDVSGSMYLDSRTYQLRSTVLLLVNLNRQMRSALAGQEIRAEFKEAIPGVPVVDRISSVVFPKEDPKRPAVEPATETHRTLRIQFLNGRP